MVAISISPLEQMSITRFDRPYYPPDWEDLSHQIKSEANWTCEDCDRPCRKPGEPWEAFCTRASVSRREKRARFVLGVAHLDQDRSHNYRSNLRALCTTCHLAHDRPFRAHNSYKKRERRGQLNLFEISTPQPAKPATPRRRSPDIKLPVRNVSKRFKTSQKPAPVAVR
jgi:hypothetical protein